MVVSEQEKKKVALVTGGAQGIGAAIVLALVGDGFNVAIADLPSKETQAAELIAKCDSRCIFISCDVSNRQQVFEAVDLTYKTFGSFDVIVNNAGILIIKSILDTTEADSAKIWSINVNGVLWGIQAASQNFISTNHPHGKIINACSIAGHRDSRVLAMYGATKFAVRSLTQSSAKELAQYNIRVNAYCPGIVNTPMWDFIDTKLCEQTGAAKGVPTQKFLETIALGRMEEPEDITGLVCFLASDRSNYVTGQSIIVDGGIVCT